MLNHLLSAILYRLFVVVLLLLLGTKTYVRCSLEVQVDDIEFVVEPSCSNNKRHHIEAHFATKTPYRVVANLDDAPYEFEGCQPQRIWYVVRHGTRNPSEKIIRAAHDRLVKIKMRILKNPHVKLCNEELARLRFWQFNVTAAEEKYLVAEGEDELLALAERMQKRFDEILPPYYDPSLYHFKYTATQRTEKSAKSFAIGLFGRENINSVLYSEPMHKDPILRFYKLCQRWEHEISKNPQTFLHVEKYREGPEMLEALNFVKRRTQLHDLTIDDVVLMYMVCSFETAWHRRREPSIWCNLFDQRTIKILEFGSDLKYYWKDGYGYELTHKIACPAIANMFECIDPNSSQPNATIYFTHSGTMLKLLSHLGLYKDVPELTYSDFKRQRAWRTSEIDAFASNLAFVLYDCPNSTPKVLTLHQERPVRLPGCPQDNDLCDYQTMRHLFADSLNNCKFEEICRK